MYKVWLYKVRGSPGEDEDEGESECEGYRSLAAPPHVIDLDIQRFQRPQRAQVGDTSRATTAQHQPNGRPAHDACKAAEVGRSGHSKVNMAWRLQGRPLVEEGRGAPWHLVLVRFVDWVVEEAE